MNGAVVFAFDKDRKRFLLVKRRDIPIWVLPGGGIEKGETPEKTAIREIKEETGYDIKIIRKVAEYIYKDSLRINHVFEAVVSGGKSTLNSEASEIAFFTPNHLPELRHPSINDWLEDLRKDSKTIIKKKISGVSIQQALLQFPKHPILVIRFLLTRVGIRINT